jgi:DNA-binding NarL/FixJ family response regulator
VLAGDSQLMMDGLACLLGRRPDVEVLGHVKDPALLLAKVGELGPDAVLVSLRAHASAPMVMARASRQLREDHPQLGIVVVSDRGNGFALELLRGGSAHSAYLLDDHVPDIDTVVLTLREVITGQTVLAASVVDALVRRRDAISIDHLTLRELEVLEQIAQGMSNRAVAVELRITVKAVENHVTAIFRKLGLTARADVHQRVAAALTYLERTR